MNSLEQQQHAFAERNRITYDEYKKLVSSMTYDQVITCLELLKAKKHKSSFRARLEAKIRAWFPDSGASKPLTDAEYHMAKPKWPIHYQLPR